LAAVAIPKLAATRDDAQAAKLASNVKTMIGEASSYTVSQGAAPKTDALMLTASNTYTEGKASGFMSTMAAGAINILDKSTGGATCTIVTVNDTNITITDGAGATAICTAIQDINPPAVITTAGTGVVR
jgi:general secretion pathway protein G